MIKPAVSMARYWQGSVVKRTKGLRTPIFDTHGAETGYFKYCRVRDSELNEALGQVKYIFSDKQGTLTQDKPKFMKIMVGRYIFCDEELPKNEEAEDPRDGALLNLLALEGREGNKARETLRCMALCHNVLFDDDINFNSACGEEFAFVKFAETYQFRLQVPEHDNGKINYVVSENGESSAYAFLDKFEYTAERERMSIIVQHDDDIVMYTRGSLKAMKELLDLSNSPDFEVVESNTTELTERGFTVTLFAYKKISLNAWNSFIDRYYKEMSKQENNDKVMELQAELEKNLNLLGAGVLKDQPNENLEDDIKFIKGAGIKFWVLTGESTSTTLRLCKEIELISENAENILLNQSSQIKEPVFKEMLKKVKANKKSKGTVCTVEGQYFSVIENYKQTNVVLFQQFRDIVMRCETVIFTKMTPMQKKSVVRMVNEYDPDSMTLAIGDSAEDVYMLDEANVSIGIEGNFGLQAAFTADYALGTFKHIIPLVFYFGRETYRKNSKLILHMFYTGIMIAMPNFWYGFFAFFSPRLLYDSVLYHAAPIIFCFLPIIYFAIFDQSYTKQRMLFSPLLYKTGLDDYYFNGFRYLATFCMAMGLSLYMTLIALMFFDFGNYENGFFFGFWNFGNMCLCGAVILVNLRVWILANSFSGWQFIIKFLSIGLYFGAWFLFDQRESSVVYKTFWEILRAMQFYFYLAVLGCLSVFEYLYEKMFYIMKERYYEPNFEVRFDANMQVAEDDDEQVDLALSGVSEQEKKKPKQDDHLSDAESADFSDVDEDNDEHD